MKNKTIVAIIYDYDWTLCEADMQNFGLAPALNMTPGEFWQKVEKNTKDTQCERILSFMYSAIKQCAHKGIRCTRKWLNDKGKNLVHYPGVLDWFTRINKYARKRGIEIEHYIISSGNKEIIEGSPIAKEFKKIFACEYYFDKDTKLPVWPKFVVNYTQKTQYIYRISKGALDVNDDVSINKKVKPRIKHSNMIYIGDGITDVPCMTVIKDYGGHSIAVYNQKKKETALALMNEERVNYAVKADYRENKELDKIVKLIIDNIAVSEELLHRSYKEKKKL